MLIIIEGADLCGKTTLANRIVGLVGGSVQHAGPPTNQHPLEAYELSVRDYMPVELDKSARVLDRFHLGECVWPTVFNRPTALDLSVRRHIELFLLSRGAHVVYAERDTLALRLDLNAAEDEPITGAQLDLVLELFERALLSSSTVATTWNFEVDGPAQLRYILRRARQRTEDAASAWHALGDGNWIGSPNPSVLYVGDEPGPLPPGRPELNLPFTPWPGTSGHYLMRCLPENWHRCAIVNSRVTAGGPIRATLGRFWRALGKPEVVALGNAAADVLTYLDVPHRRVYHPQYWRRFHHHQPDEYTRQLAC